MRYTIIFDMVYYIWEDWKYYLSFRVVPQFGIAKLVNISPITMVYR